MEFKISSKCKQCEFGQKVMGKPQNPQKYNTINQLEALGERRPPPSDAVGGACAKTRFNLAFRLYRPERHQNLITCSLSPDLSSKFYPNPFITFQ